MYSHIPIPFFYCFAIKGYRRLETLSTHFFRWVNSLSVCFAKTAHRKKPQKHREGSSYRPPTYSERKKMRTIADIQMDLLRLKNRMHLSALSNDSYFLSAQYKEDCRRKFELEQELQKKWEIKRRIDIETAY